MSEVLSKVNLQIFCLFKTKYDYENQPSFFFQYKGTFREYKILMSLNLSGTNRGELNARPPSCSTP